MKSKLIYYFGGSKADGNATMKTSLGGKGANLAEMVNLGLPVPAGLTISSAVCAYFSSHAGRYPAGLKQDVEKALKKVERVMGSKFGDPTNPLLVSVRSGAAVSMPGMMDTVLNLGLNDRTIKGLIQKSGNERFAYDCYRRFVQMYGDVVMGLKPASSEERDPFEILLEQKKREVGVAEDSRLSAEDLKDLVRQFKEEILARTGETFPENPARQLWGAIGAVFGSWDNDRAISYRRLHRIRGDMGTAVNVVAMVYGNMGEDSGTGVAFTRNPATGEKELYGEYLLNAQGEDVVAGTRTPLPIAALREEMPVVYQQLERVRQTLEKHYRDMQDMEFTIQNGRLWMLQTRTGKRTGMAAVRVAVDMVREKLITEKDALMRLEPTQLNQLLQPNFRSDSKQRAVESGALLGKGLPAGPGSASGKIVLTAEEAVRRKALGEAVILVRTETSPDDIDGMNAALGILTQRGGMTSHAALVGRQMGKVCVVGCDVLEIDYKAKTVRSRDRELREGEEISIDGTTGEVFAGGIETVPSEVLQVMFEKTLRPEESPSYQRFETLLGWADKHRRLKVRANADTGPQCRIAVAFGAEGVGLCRTEHMFFGEGKIEHIQHMILSDSTAEREQALARLLPIQRADFVEIFRAMDGRPVTVRLLDPPLHEFLPHTEADQLELAERVGITVEHIQASVRALAEFNPMLGFRGCRLGIVHPEITEMQARAILEAACDVEAEGIAVQPEIMIPLVGNHKEFRLQEQRVRAVARAVLQERGSQLKFLVGTMIEIPRAALTAGEVAEAADFFSFGTNDLTQTALGLSRDDSGRFLQPYIEQEIYTVDPFQSLDIPGVGQLVEIAVERGRATRPKLKIGICGEHGGDPDSIEFFHRVGLEYVSCSPYRLPIARVAAAKAALLEAGEKQVASRTKGRVPARKKPSTRTKATGKPRAAAARAAKKTRTRKAAARVGTTGKQRKKAASKATPRKATRKKAAARKTTARKASASRKAPGRRKAATRPRAASRKAPSRAKAAGRTKARKPAPRSARPKAAGRKGTPTGTTRKPRKKAQAAGKGR